MGESYVLPIPEFNRSVRIETRPERLTAEVGALALREAGERLGILGWLEARLVDPRDQEKITHPLRELVTTSVLLAALGWRDQDDADTLRNDPILRLAVSTRRGTSPLEPPPVDEGTQGRQRVPDGLASQPTLSRTARLLSTDKNRETLRESLSVLAGRRIRAMRGGHRIRHVMVDVDSLPVEVEGHQEGSVYNGHYHARIYHPLVASIGETGDLVDVRLREGNVHTAEGALEFILPLLDRVEREIAQVAGVRIDAGFPSEPLLFGLESRRLPVPYVARIKNNAALNRLAQPHLEQAPTPDGAEPQLRFHEMEYRAGSWSRARRAVLVVQDRPGELFAHHFWLLTSWSAEQMPAADLLAIYRRRGNAENLMGEWMNVLSPALSSARRPKSHYRGNTDFEPSSQDWRPFDVNAVTLLLSALAYNLAHVVRTLVEKATKRGWGLMKIREHVLRIAARVLIHARRVTVVLPAAAAPHWASLWEQLGRLPGLALRTRAT